MEIEKKLREEIESLVKDYFEKVHYEQNFVPHNPSDLRYQMTE